MNNETEYWKVVNDITKPTSVNTWSLRDGNELNTDENFIADKFNSEDVLITGILVWDLLLTL